MDPSDYLNKLGKHPRINRGYELNDDTRVKQPRPMEDGNWICEDPSCGNVNFPRRKQCNKCGRARGASGDAVVENYVHMVQASRGEGGPVQMASMSGMGSMGGMGGMGLMPMQQVAMPGMQGGAAPSAAAGDTHAGIHVVTFKPSSADLSEEGHVLGQQILEGMQQCGGVAAAAELLAHASAYVRSAASNGGAAPAASATMVQQVQMAPQQMMMQTGMPGGYMQMQTPMMMPVMQPMMQPMMSRGGGGSGKGGGKGKGSGKAADDWEYFQHCPSDWLKEFGDPAAARGARGEMRAGDGGKWRCEKCNNINFPRRDVCNKCQTKRGTEGDDIVKQYVHDLMQDRVGSAY